MKWNTDRRTRPTFQKTIQLVLIKSLLLIVDTLAVLTIRFKQFNAETNLDGRRHGQGGNGRCAAVQGISSHSIPRRAAAAGGTQQLSSGGHRHILTERLTPNQLFHLRIHTLWTDAHNHNRKLPRQSEQGMVLVGPILDLSEGSSHELSHLPGANSNSYQSRLPPWSILLANCLLANHVAWK